MEGEMKPKTGPKDFFLYLTATATLYASVVALLHLLFSIINYAFPDELFYSGYTGSVRASIATLIIIFPLYLVIMWVARRDLEKMPAKRDLWVRRWLSYLTIFLAGIAVVIDLVVLVNTFLSGEITIRFVLKVLSVLAVSAGAFGYYLYDIKKEISRKRCLSLTWISIALVLAVIIGGFFVMGSPMQQRDMRFDRERVEDLSMIQYQITEYWRNKEVLPSELSELEDELRGFIVPTDPETGADYVYNTLGGMSFELCATFALPSQDSEKERVSIIGGPYGEFGTLETWEHGVGEVCFERTIDPDFFPKPVRF